MTFLMNYEGYRIYNTQLYLFIKTLSAIDAVPMETVIDHQKKSKLGQLCNLPCSNTAKCVFNIRLRHFQHINRTLNKYALHHVLDRYLLDGVFPFKCAWKWIIYEKTIRQSNSELFHECVENYPTCAPLI